MKLRTHGLSVIESSPGKGMSYSVCGNCSGLMSLPSEGASLGTTREDRSHKKVKTEQRWAQWGAMLARLSESVSTRRSRHPKKGCVSARSGGSPTEPVGEAEVGRGKKK